MQDYFFVKEGGSRCRISFAALLYIESVKRYVRFVTAERTFLTEASLYKVEHLLPSDQFCRIHRSYIVSLQHARLFDKKTITIADIKLPIGRHYRSILSERVLLIDRHLTLTGKQINDLFNPPAE